MKKSILIIIGFLFIVPFEGLCQTAYYAMPNLTISPSNRSTLGNNIKRYGEIKTSGSFNLLQGTQTELISNEKITLSSPVIIQPSSSGTYANNVFNAKIEKTDLELVWYAPNSPGWVKKNDKLEIGIKLPANYEAQLQNFIDHQDNPNSLPQLNPYNPEHIDIQADCYLKVGGSWILNKKKFAFFYEEFERDMSDLSDKNNWDWIDLPTSHRFRIRMTPEHIGEWKCEITTKINGVTLPTITSFLFNCYNSNLDGFVSSVNSPWSTFYNSLYINNEPFFPIGRAMPHPSVFTYEDLNGNTQDPYNCQQVINSGNYASWSGHLMKTKGIPLPLQSYIVYEQELRKLKQEGANFFRISRTASDYFLEFEHLGNYYKRMFLGWEMDKLLETLDDIDLKMYFTLSHSNELSDTTNNWGSWNWDWNPVDPSSSKAWDTFDKGYCYGVELGIKPNEFFTDEKAKKHYKNKLRYIISRWGYSTSIAVIDLFNETNQIKNNHKAHPVLDSDLEAWHLEMHDYIKNGLGHKHQLIGIHHTGYKESLDIGPIASFSDSNVDVVSISHYRMPFNRGELLLKNQGYSQMYQKPFLFLEIGGDDCDRFVEHSKDLWATAFNCYTGAGLNWHHQHSSEQMWHQYGNLTNFIGTKDLQTYYAKYDINKNKTGEIHYKYNKVDHKAIGVITNRSWNQYTYGEGSCIQDTSYKYTDEEEENYDKVKEDELDEISPYVVLESRKFDNKFKVEVGGSLQRYIVDYYSVLGGSVQWIGNEGATSSFGSITLKDYPTVDKLIAFKIYRRNVSFLIPPGDTILDNKNDKTVNINSAERNQDSLNELTNAIVENDEILIYPNPTKNKFVISVSTSLNNTIESFVVIGLRGEIIIESSWDKEMAKEMDLSDYSSGTYVLAMYGGGKYYYKRIIKQ